VKHISVVAYISGRGVCLTPYVVTSQDSAAVRRDLEADGMQIGRHLILILKQRDKPYVNAKFFEDYLCSVFLPYLMITRIVKDLREEDVVSLMDNCSPHITSLRVSSNFSRLPVGMCAWLWLHSAGDRTGGVARSRTCSVDGSPQNSCFGGRNSSLPTAESATKN
jgi:hypothetical protein